MLVIRLSRTGRNKYPTYRIVAAEQARAATGKFISILGHYNPHTKELVIKREEIGGYLTNGAQPSNSVLKLLQREQIELPKWASVKTRQRAPKKVATPVAAAAPEVAPAEPETAEAAPESVVETAEANAEVIEANAQPADQAETADAAVVEAETEPETAEAEAAEATAEAPAEPETTTPAE